MERIIKKIVSLIIKKIKAKRKTEKTKKKRERIKNEE